MEGGEEVLNANEEALALLKRQKAPGPDDIPIELLKELNDEMIQSLTHLLNNWWEDEDIPESMPLKPES